MTAKPSAQLDVPTALRFRREFDASFAAARLDPPANEDFLAVRIGGDPHAFRLAEIGSLHGNTRILALPSASPELLGIVSLRDVLAPVYDLRLLLGYASGPAPRWFVLDAASQPLAFAFDALEGLLRMPRGCTAAPDPAAARQHFAGVLPTAPVRPVIDMASLRDALAQRLRSGRAQEVNP